MRIFAARLCPGNLLSGLASSGNVRERWMLLDARVARSYAMSVSCE
jgi:hypothetical protein